MDNADPILQCTACGAKLKLRAATLKVIKQVRCVKCQAALEIPAALKDGGQVPDGPIPANPIAAPDATSVKPAAATSVKPAAAAPVPSSAVAPAPAAPVAVAPAAVVPVSAPASTAPAVAAAKPPTAPVAAAPVSTPGAAVPPPSVSAAPVSSGDQASSARLAELERRLDAQEDKIAALSSQLRKLVQLQAAAANACMAGLPK